MLLHRGKLQLPNYPALHVLVEADHPWRDDWRLAGPADGGGADDPRPDRLGAGAWPRRAGLPV